MKPTEHHAGGADDVTGGHEQSDVNIRGIVVFIAALVVSAVLIHLGILKQFEFYESRADRGDPPRAPLAAKPGKAPPEPRLQGMPWNPATGWLTPQQDFEAFHRVEEERLHGYGWVNEGAGLVHIPIERAMELVVQRTTGKSK